MSHAELAARPAVACRAFLSGERQKRQVSHAKAQQNSGDLIGNSAQYQDHNKYSRKRQTKCFCNRALTHNANLDRQNDLSDLQFFALNQIPIGKFFVFAVRSFRTRPLVARTPTRRRLCCYEPESEQRTAKHIQFALLYARRAGALEDLTGSTA